MVITIGMGKKTVNNGEEFTPSNIADDKFVAGQPKLGKKREGDVANTYYRLGRTSAALDQKRDEIKQAQTVSAINKLMIEQTKNQLQDILMQVTLKQKELDMQTGGGGQQYPQLPVQPANQEYPPLSQEPQYAGDSGQGGQDMQQGMPDMGQQQGGYGQSPMG